MRSIPIVHNRGIRLLLLASVFTIATCGLIYELIAGTHRQLSARGFGHAVLDCHRRLSLRDGHRLVAFALRREESSRRLHSRWNFSSRSSVDVGRRGFLRLVRTTSVRFRVLLYAIVLLIGTLVGLEIPLLLRILKDRLQFKDLISKVFTFDYIGALLAVAPFSARARAACSASSRSGFLLGILNGARRSRRALRTVERSAAARVSCASTALAVLGLLGLGFACSDRIVSLSEAAALRRGRDFLPIDVRISASRSRARADDFRLFLNGNLQFSSRDEYRYHESLIHPGLARLPHAPARARARRRRWPRGARSPALPVDRERHAGRSRSGDDAAFLDPGNPDQRSTRDALTSPEGASHQCDAFTWLKENREIFDFIVVDFPDPSNFQPWQALHDCVLPAGSKRAGAGRRHR